MTVGRSPDDLIFCCFLFKCPAFAKERDTFLERLYELHPITRGLSPEGQCAYLMGDVLPHETENYSIFYLHVGRGDGDGGDAGLVPMAVVA